MQDHPLAPVPGNPTGTTTLERAQALAEELDAARPCAKCSHAIHRGDLGCTWCNGSTINRLAACHHRIQSAFGALHSALVAGETAHAIRHADDLEREAALLGTLLAEVSP